MLFSRSEFLRAMGVAVILATEAKGSAASNHNHKMALESAVISISCFTIFRHDLPRGNLYKILNMTVAVIIK